MNGKAKAKQSGCSFNSILKMTCILLVAILVIYLVKTKMDIVKMEEQLVSMEQQVETQRLKNKDAQLSLREDDSTMERIAREKLDYAHPDERVFVDISGSK